MNLEKLKRYSPLLLRTGIAIVFLWFGFTQLKSPGSWTRMVPSYLGMLEPITWIYINGVFEVILGTMLVLGLFTRATSFLLTLNLLHIVTMVGYGPTGARDVALAIATFSIFAQGIDEFCLDNFRHKKEEKKSEK